MIQPQKVKGINPHYIDGQTVYFSIGNSVYSADIHNVKNKKFIGSYNAGFLKNIASGFAMLKRAARLGFHKLKPFKGGFIAIQHGCIVYKAPGENKFKNVFSGFRGSRPLDIFVTPDEETVYFGEYFSNQDREEVYIYASKDLINWKKAWVFKPGEIRHVHGIVWDGYKKGIWVLTGDSDQESGIWFTADNFATLDKVVEGSQKARAVEIIPVEEGLLIPMDSPLELNYLYHYGYNTKAFTELAALPGSAFHACHINGIFLLSTVTEPSTVNVVDYASVWASTDGKKWKEISQFKRDIVPVKYQFIFRYAEIYFASGTTGCDYIAGYGQAVKGADNSMLLWDKKEVIHYLDS